MEKVFHFDSPQEVYTADACVITCFDARFDLVVRKFLKRRGIALYDHIKIPGSAKWLAAPDSEADREAVLRMVRVSMALHATRRALLVGHNECGAYPGQEPGAVVRDLIYAAEVLRGKEPSLEIECYFTNFDGVYQVA